MASSYSLPRSQTRQLFSPWPRSCTAVTTGWPSSSSTSATSTRGPSSSRQMAPSTCLTPTARRMRPRAPPPMSESAPMRTTSCSTWGHQGPSTLACISIFYPRPLRQRTPASLCWNTMACMTFMRPTAAALTWWGPSLCPVMGRRRGRPVLIAALPSCYRLNGE